MKMIDIRCPHCDSVLTVSEDRKDLFCEYCGAHLILDDETIKITKLNIIRDEARIKEADVELKRIEHDSAAAQAKAAHIVEIEKIKADKLAKAEIKKAKIEARAAKNSTPLRTLLKFLWMATLFLFLSFPGWEKKLPDTINHHNIFNYLFFAWFVITVYLLITHRRKR